MKTLSLTLIALLLIPLSLLACKVEIAIDSSTYKKEYSKGDIIVVTVTIERQHKNCASPLEETEFTPTGMQITESSDWKNIGSDKWQKTVKLKIISSANGMGLLALNRICKNEKKGASDNFIVANIPKE